MNVAYFEMIGGASGNMLLGALVDAGADLAAIERALRTIPVDGWTLECEGVVKCGIAATHLDFAIPGEDHDHGHEHEHGHAHRDGHSVGRTLDEVLDIVARSGLSASQKERASKIYVRLGEAEAKVHGESVRSIHFHEVGAIDAILDVAGACVALDLLDVERVYCSAFPIGLGAIVMQHGRYPNPPPATAELLRGAPTYDAGIDGEMVTTTGAAILTSLVSEAGVRPAMAATRIGYGAGRSEFTIPNVLRASIGSLVEVESIGSFASDEIAVLECNVDDMSPQRFELALERALAAGAVDVWLAPVTMKKSRPAILFGALAPLGAERAVAAAMLSETTTLGVRVRHERRYVLAREISTVETPLGSVRVKTATHAGAARRTLEYDDVARIARERAAPYAEIAARLEEFLPPL